LDGLTIRNAPFVGVYCSEYATTLRNCVLEGNFIALYAGSRSAPRLVDCRIADNTLAISANGARPMIYGCALQGNGIGVLASAGGVVIRNSAIKGNLGAGVDTSDGELTMSNCFVLGNGDSGARVNKTQTSIWNCTLTGNVCADYGGGIRATGYENAMKVEVQNCIVWGNNGFQDVQIAANAIGELTLSIAYTDVQSGLDGVYVHGTALLWGPGNIDTDPGLVASDNYHLRAGSACIDAGAPKGFYESQTDLDRQGRVCDGDGDSQCRADIGADEFLRVAGDMNCDGVIDFGDINPFVEALQSPGRYWAAFDTCNIFNADINGDGQIDFGDINPFVELMLRGW
jgi:hypothetical protein